MSTVAHLTLEEYDRMIQRGVFDEGRRLEFIRGEIREMSPLGPEHEEVVDRLENWSAQIRAKHRIRVRVQNSIGVPKFDAAPQPDIAWVVPRSYRRKRPSAADVFLVIEVAESSLAYDRGEKLDLYAAGGINDYWIVNLTNETIEVYREPEERGYRSKQVLKFDNELRPLAFPDVVLRPSMLFED